MRKLLVWTCLVLAVIALASSCQVAEAREAPRPQVAVVADTFEVTARWTLPEASVGLDSVEVVAYGPWSGPLRQVIRPPLTTTTVFRWPIPEGETSAGTFGVCVIFWRRGVPSGGLWPTASASATVPANCSQPQPYSYSAAPPPLATGVTASYRVIRP